MDQTSTWSAVDTYFTDHLVQTDSVLTEVLLNNEKAGLPSHDVSPNQGALLNLYVKLGGAKHILEIGTLGAYSSIWMARALPHDGRLISLELDSQRAEIARKNVRLADLQSKIEIRVGPALELLPQIEKEGPGHFDLIFIDADKVNNPHYFAWALKLGRVGSLIIVDNVVRNGAILDSNCTDPSVQGVRKLAEILKYERRVQSTVVQTVGTKGWDGYILSRITGE